MKAIFEYRGVGKRHGEIRTVDGEISRTRRGGRRLLYPEKSEHFPERLTMCMQITKSTCYKAKLLRMWYIAAVIPYAISTK